MVRVTTGMSLVTFDTSGLFRRRFELNALSKQAAAISTLLDTLSSSINEVIPLFYALYLLIYIYQVRSKWVDGIAPLSTKLDLLKQMLKGIIVDTSHVTPNKYICSQTLEVTVQYNRIYSISL